MKQLLKPINYLGLAIFPFVFMATGMSTDSTGTDNLHWAHEAFIFGNLAIGPFCLAGALSKRMPYLGLIGFAFAIAGWTALTFACDGEFRCGAM